MNDETRAKLHEIYDKIPKIKCRGLCTDECTNIGFFRPEFEHLVQITGRTPRLDVQTERCNFLNALGRCEVYDDRPLVCRAYGVDLTMPCPHGCEAERIMSRMEGLLRLREIVQLLGTGEVMFNSTPQILFQILRKQGVPKQEARHTAKLLSKTKHMPL
jgi:Fe-S-cluster containining protein